MEEELDTQRGAEERRHRLQEVIEVPIPDWHWDILEQRLKTYEKDPKEGQSLEEFRESLLEDTRRRRQGRR